METGNKWIARRRLITGGKVYNAGCEVPSKVLGRNARELERTGYIWNAPANQPVAGLTPVDLPKPSAPPKRPKVAKCIIRLRDPISSVQESVREARKYFTNDSDALLFLQTSDEFCQIYKLAVAAAVAAKKAEYKGRAPQSVTPEMCGF